MGKRVKLERGRDVTKILRQNDCPVRNGKGSHLVGTLPTGEKITYYAGELSPNMKARAIKILTAVGLFGFLIGALAAILI